MRSFTGVEKPPLGGGEELGVPQTWAPVGDVDILAGILKGVCD